MIDSKAKALTFDEEYEQLIYGRFIVLSLISIPIHALFIVFDFYVIPSDFLEMLTFRGMILISVVANFFLVTRRIIKPTNSLYVQALLYSWTISYMGTLTQPQYTPLFFHNGNLQVLIGILGFVPWKNLKTSLLVFCIVTSAYYLYRPFINLPLELQELMPKVFFDIFVFVFTYFANQSFLNSKMQEHYTRTILANEVQSREQIIADQVLKITSQQKRILENEIEHSRNKGLADLAAQVAHDIRSPLTAMNMVLGDLPTNESAKKLASNAIQRINDIANNLLTYRRKISNQNQSNWVFIEPLIDSVVTEKRYKLSTKNLEIKIGLEPRYPPIICKLPRTVIASALSNFLDNAIEASNGKPVEVTVTHDRFGCKMKIVDYGRGIPDGVLKKLGIEPTTHGKPDGNGLGVYNSIHMLKEQKCRVDIESKEERGTTITIELPATDTPQWLSTRIELGKVQVVAIIDDDPSIHSMWKNKINNHNLKLFYFFDTESAQVWLATCPEKALLLVDCEFHGDAYAGIDFITRNKLQNSSFLVTSKYDDDTVIRACSEQSVRVIPKFLATAVPIS